MRCDMFDSKYIEEKINIIFDIEQNNLNNGEPFCYIETRPSESDPSKPLYKAFGRSPLINSELKPEDNFRLEWGTYTTLKKLYNKIENDPKARKIFIDLIKEKLLNGSTIVVGRESPEFYDCSSLAFYFLMKLGKNSENIETLKNIYGKKKHDRSRQGLFESVLKFIHLEPAYFDDDTLTSLKEFNSQNTYFAGSFIRDEFEEKINSVRYKKLQNELGGINEELNIDKERLIEKIAEYGFPQEMESFLLEIGKIHGLSDWESINSGMIGNMRSFFEMLIKNIAEKIKLETGYEYPKDSDRGHLGNVRFYIKTNLELSSHDDKLIDSFVNILHKEGGHAFLSEKKYFLLTRNIGIEIAYFLLSKLEDFFEK